MPAVRFQHTAARRRLRILQQVFNVDVRVSTHSRPKAAADWRGVFCTDANKFQHTAARRRLPVKLLLMRKLKVKFQHTAARRRLLNLDTLRWTISKVSTHSRPKAAAKSHHQPQMDLMFQHTAARRRLLTDKKAILGRFNVSTHSRPKAAARRKCINWMRRNVSTHSRPKAAARLINTSSIRLPVFQHTAARRRLPIFNMR